MIFHTCSTVCWKSRSFSAASMLMPDRVMLHDRWTGFSSNRGIVLHIVMANRIYFDWEGEKSCKSHGPNLVIGPTQEISTIYLWSAHRYKKLPVALRLCSSLLILHPSLPETYPQGHAALRYPAFLEGWVFLLVVWFEVFFYNWLGESNARAFSHLAASSG